MKRLLVLTLLVTLLFGGGAVASKVYAGGETEGSRPVDLGNGSGTWQAMDSNTEHTLYGVWGVSGSNVFAVGASSTILRYSGYLWSPHDTPGTTGDIEDVCGNSSVDVFAVQYDSSLWGSGATLLKYITGSTWTQMTSFETDRALYGIWSSSSADIFVVGEKLTIYHYNSITDTLTLMNGGEETDPDLTGVWGTSPNDVFAVGDEGAILYYNGNQWTFMYSGTKVLLEGIWGTSHNDVFAVGDEGTILHYNGSTWSQVNIGESWLSGVWGSSSSDVFAVGQWGTILHYNGSTWSSMTSGTTAWLWDVWGSSGQDVFAVGSPEWDGQQSTILHYTYDPSTLYVSKYEGCGGNNPCYETIQDAIDAAAINAVIKIARGTYAGSMTLNKSLSLTLQGGWDTDFQSPAGTTLLRQAPKAPKGSLTLQRLTIRP